MINEIDKKIDTIDITEPCPAEEPFLQYYFIKKARGYYRELAKKAGRNLTCSIQTYGCQMNVRDSEKLTGILEEIGYTSSDSEDADLVIYNTCTVRENANRKVYGHLGIMKHDKETHPDKMIGLCGCMMQEPDVVATIQKKYRFVDMVFGTHNVFKLAEIYCNRIEAGGQVVDIWKDTNLVVEDLPVKKEFPFKSGVNIMFGCNNFCTYCIVPYVRGRERSRQPEDIIREVKRLSEEGVKEIMLLGQNVNSYGKTLEEPMTFAELLQKVTEVDGIERVRFMTSHPKDLSNELIDVIAANEKICRHIHLPMQSGSSRILNQMNRRYTKESYLELVDKIRRQIPEISLTTDIIVGFPGETEEDFQASYDFVKDIYFYETHIFKYSRREGTKAAVMPDQVSEGKKSVRSAEMIEMGEQKRRAYEESFIGKEVEVLVEEEIERNGEIFWTGHTKEYIKIALQSRENLRNCIVKVQIEDALQIIH